MMPSTKAQNRICIAAEPPKAEDMGTSPSRITRLREDHTPDSAAPFARALVARKEKFPKGGVQRRLSQKRAVFLRTLPRPRKGRPKAVQPEATTWPR